jgi:integrase
MSIQRISKGKYKVQVIRRDPRTGKRRRRREVVNGTRADAAEREREIADALASGHVQTPPTLGEFARSWLKARRDRINVTTLRTYGTDLRVHILPALGELRVDLITVADVRGLLEQMREAGKAPRTRGKVLALLKTMCGDMLADELIQRDPCTRIKPPRSPGYTDENPNLLTAEELRRLLDVVPAAWRPHVLCAAFTGIRFGELSALRWDDIDFDGRVMRLRRGNSKGVIVGDSRQKKKRRDIPLEETLVTVLRAHRAAMGADLLGQLEDR